MRVHLFNDKQVSTILKSVMPKFVKVFDKANEEIKVL